MTDQQHPITPPPELVKLLKPHLMQWLGEFYGDTLNCELELNASELYLAGKAAQWGADEKLNACKEWLKLNLMKHDLYEGYAYLYDDCSQAYIREKELLKDLQEAMRPTTTQENN